MIRRIATLPDRMISQRVTKPGYKLESALIVVLGLIGAAGFGYVGSKALGAVEGGTETLRFEFIGAALQPFAALLVLWIGYTVLSHVLANLYQGRGPTSRLLRVSAWSLLPVGLWIAIRSLVIFGLFFTVDIPADPEGMGAAETFQTIVDLGLDSPVYTLVLLSGVLFAAWSWRLLSRGVAEAKGVDEESARKIAAVPTGITAIYFVWLALGHAGVV